MVMIDVKPLWNRIYPLVLLCSRVSSMERYRGDSKPPFQIRVTLPSEESRQEAATDTPLPNMAVKFSATDSGDQERMAQWCATLANSQNPLDWDFMARIINKRSPNRPPISPEECRWVFS